VVDLPGVLRALRQVGFSGHLALEYETNPDNPMPGILESFGYLRGGLAVLEA
jgi:sugar phosphate isomerase/epimerase